MVAGWGEGTGIPGEGVCMHTCACVQAHAPCCRAVGHGYQGPQAGLRQDNW